jgi:hypothetical protein
MGDELIFQKNLIASLFNKYLSYETNFSQIHLKRQYLYKKNMNFFIIFWQRGVSMSAKSVNSVTISYCEE